MVEVKRDFLNNNHSYINFILDKIESFSNHYQNKIVYPKTHPNYNKLTNSEIKEKIFMLLNNNKEDFISEIEKKIELCELKMNYTLLAGEVHDSIRYSLKVKTQQGLDIVLNFKYTIYSKEASFESIEIENKNCNGSLWKFESISKSVIIPIGSEKKSQNKSEMEYLEIVTKNDKISDYVALSNDYKGLFQLREDLLVINLVHDRTDTYDTHDYLERIQQLKAQNPEVAYKCLFSNAQNSEDLSDLMLLNYDIVFDKNFKRFHANLDDFYNIKILGNEVNMLEYERKMKRAISSLKV